MLDSLMEALLRAAAIPIDCPHGFGMAKSRN